MPIDPSQAIGTELPLRETQWDTDAVIRYHLGVGAGVGKATDAQELEYTYERNLKVLPSFATIPVGGALGGLNSVPGIDINFAMVLHGEQSIELHRPIPASAKIETRPRVVEIWDKRRAALIVIETVSREVGGDDLFTNRMTLFARGEGGFGGEPGPKPTGDTPAREPDLVVDSPTTSHQALLYRLNGDKNPLHVDPEFATKAGFDTPILHGLCTYGIVCKAVVDAALDGDVAQVASYRTRFSGVVFPGETIRTSIWRDDGSLWIEATTLERGTPVLRNATITLR